MIRLENWSVTESSDPYVPPERKRPSLAGLPFGHPNKTDGRRITTSAIVKAEGRVITTASGSVYVLGQIDPKYREYLRKERPNWDWRNPVTILK